MNPTASGVEGGLREANPVLHATARAAGTLAIVSLVSPVVGLTAEAALAWRFGASGTMDAFRLAVTVPGFAQQLLILQLLPNVVVPLLALYRARGATDEGLRVVIALGRVLVACGLVASLAIFFSAGSIAELLGPGLSLSGRETTAICVRAFASTLVPIAWMSVAGGVLYFRGIFWPPIVAQIVNNVGLVVGILASRGGSSLAYVLAAMVATSYLNAVWIGFLAYAKRGEQDSRSGFRVRPWDRRVRDALRPGVPVLANVLVTQVLVVFFLNRLSTLDTGTVAAFGYAWKIQQLASLLPTALATVMLPRFASELAGAQPQAGRTLVDSIRMAWFLAIPLAAIGFLWRGEIVEFAFQRGQFSTHDTALCASLLGWLFAAMPVSVCYTYLQQFLYAGRRGWWPAASQAFALALLAAGAAPAMSHFAAQGMIFLLVAGQWAGALLLAWPARRLGGEALTLRLATFAALTSAVGVGSAWAVRTLGLLSFPSLPPSPPQMLASVALGGSLVLVAYEMVALALGSREGVRLKRFAEWGVRAFLAFGTPEKHAS